MADQILYAFYDLEVSPNSFDFSAFIICAETHRIENKLQKIHIVIVPQEKGKGHHDNSLFDDKHAKWRVNNVIIPMTQFISSCGGITVSPNRAHAANFRDQIARHVFPNQYSVEFPVSHHHTGWSIIDAHLNKNVQHFKATEQAREYARQWIDTHSGGKKCIAITLREAPFMEIRNSNLDVWGDLAQRLKNSGFFPVLLRDIERALDTPLSQFEGVEQFPEGVFNLGLRLGFYEEADVCAFVANGPGQLCFYSKNVNFIYVVTGDWLHKNPTPFGRMGIKFGETPPTANQFQRWLWKEQDPELLYSEIIKLEHDVACAKDAGTYNRSLAPIFQNRLPISELTKRFVDWANRTYGVSLEQTKLAEACLNLSKVSDNYDMSSVNDIERLQLEQLINSAMADKNFDKAITLLGSTEERFGLTFGETVKLGVVHEAMENWSEAIRRYQAALEMQANAPDVEYRLGSAYQSAGEWELSREIYETLVARGSKYPALYESLGKVYQNMNLLDKAAECLKIAGDLRRSNIYRK